MVLNQRDYYIIAQALHIAVREMRKVPPPHNEPNNVRDMERLLNELFPHYESAFKIIDEIAAKQGKGLVG